MILRAAFLISLALMMAGALAIVFWSAPMIGAGGLDPFDTRADGYSFDEARAFLAALTDASRAAYLGPQRLADTVFPIGLLGTLACGTAIALKHWSARFAASAALVPLAYFIFDMLENAGVARLLRAGPEGITPDAVARVSLFTQGKFWLVDAAIVLLVLAWGARAVVWLRRGRER